MSSRKSPCRPTRRCVRHRLVLTPHLGAPPPKRRKASVSKSPSRFARFFLKARFAMRSTCQSRRAGRLGRFFACWRCSRAGSRRGRRSLRSCRAPRCRADRGRSRSAGVRVRRHDHLHRRHAGRDHQLQLMMLAVAVEGVLDAGIVAERDGDAGRVQPGDAALLLRVRRRRRVRGGPLRGRSALGHFLIISGVALSASNGSSSHAGLPV